MIAMQFFVVQSCRKMNSTENLYEKVYCTESYKMHLKIVFINSV